MNRDMAVGRTVGKCMGMNDFGGVGAICFVQVFVSSGLLPAALGLFRRRDCRSPSSCALDSGNPETEF